MKEKITGNRNVWKSQLHAYCDGMSERKKRLVLIIMLVIGMVSAGFTLYRCYSRLSGNDAPLHGREIPMFHSKK